MENPTPTTSDSLTSTLCNSIQALGRGFDVTSDFRLLYCKGAPGSRLVYLDEEHATDLVLSRALVLPNVSSDICCSPGQSSMEKIPVCTFHEVISFCIFSCLLDFDYAVLFLFFFFVNFIVCFWESMFGGETGNDSAVSFYFWSAMTVLLVFLVSRDRDCGD